MGGGEVSGGGEVQGGVEWSGAGWVLGLIRSQNDHSHPQLRLTLVPFKTNHFLLL